MDVSRRGISLAGILQFVDGLGGATAIEGKTTSAVCEELVKPATAASRRSVVADLEAAGSPQIADATVFVSHAWAFRFADVLAALESWETRQKPGSPPAFFWFDIFTNSQHDVTNRPFEWWNTTFKTAVASIGHTLLVLAWDDPKPLRRAWCLVEIVATLTSAGASLDIVMAPEEEARFRRSLLDDFESLVYKTCKTDLSTATAYHGGECLVNGVCRDLGAACPNDLALIKGAVEAGIGFEEANMRVIARLREWMAAAGTEALAKLSAEERGISALLPCVARLLKEQERRAEAELLCREALAGRRARLGEAHADTLECGYRLAAVLLEQGMLAEAEPLYREVLKGRRALLGEENEATLAGINGLAMLLDAKEDYAEAEALHTEALAARRRVLGNLHDATINSMSNVAGHFLRSKRLDDAASLYQEAFLCSKDLLGAEHPSTLCNANNFAHILAKQGHKIKAVELYQSTIVLLRRTLGPEHNYTRGSIDNLTGLLSTMVKEDKETVQSALSMFQEHLAANRSTLGVEHPCTQELLTSVGLLLQSMTRLPEAEVFLREVHDVRIRAYGLRHPYTRMSARRLATCVGRQGRVDEAHEIVMDTR